MKYLFLGMDGVANCFSREIENDVKIPKAIWRVNSEKVKFLNVLVEDTGVSVILSSTWRIGETIESMNSVFKQLGFTFEITDFTDTTGPLRGNEIHRFLADKDYEEYLIIDDDSDMLYWQRNNFMQIDGSYGLSSSHVWKAVRFLNGTTRHL